MSFFGAMHALVGVSGVCAGALSLSLRKGSLLHKFAGRLFTVSMVLMLPIVLLQAWFGPESISSLGILFVSFIAYLVLSAWSTIQRSEHGATALDFALPLVAACVSVAGLSMGFGIVVTIGGGESAPPIEAYFFFSLVSFVALLLDINNLYRGGVRGNHRIARHVWRMSMALFFATSSLFTGPGSIIFPESVRGHSVLLAPQLLVLIAAIYWLYRLLFSSLRYS